MALNAATPEFLCSNLERSVKFYVDLLGFKIVFERPEHKFVYLEREGIQIMLEELGAAREWITAELTYPFGRGMNFQIAVSNVVELYKAVRQASWPIFLELEEKWYRQKTTEKGNHQFLVQDPDGYLLRFAEDLGSRSFQS
jgi:catechol 2,3-dioxygenase-like lactoylglutathione lyase family enzyme